MEKIDVKKRYKALYGAPIGAFIVLDLPPLTYFAVDGAGNPNTAAEYGAAVEALYAASYTLKFMSKDSLKSDYVVPPLEGLWWADDMADFTARRKDRWKWRMMILVPDFVGDAMAKEAIARTKAKKKLPGLSKLCVTRLEEGRVAQTLHVGSYDDEGPILERLHGEFLPANGLAPTGHHHEIYLSDPRKTAADKLKTVLRQPVRSFG
ncbi:GyrI-like domain-containing protein [Xanthobacter sp. KR7-225]|uniref:GyrI-like domain-containing protein n=1 Tax=Xanthobacter sp. KR7-225 TaxID=3156613 RepID=UPI0032B3A56C